MTTSKSSFSSALPARESGSRSRTQGFSNSNRADTRDRKSVVKDSTLSNQPPNLDTIYEERGKGVIPSDLRKGKVKTKRSGDKSRRSNLGPTMKRHPLDTKRPKGTQCVLISKILRDKSHRGNRFVEHVQRLLKGTIFETDFVYVSCTPYLRTAEKFVVVNSTPSMGQTRLLLHQILRCRSNFPWDRLLSRCDIPFSG